MLKRLIIIWALANFAIVGTAALITGRWYLSWPLSTFAQMWVEIGLIVLPNLLISWAVLRYGWLGAQGPISSALGWQWAGWRSIAVSFAAFLILVFTSELVTELLGEGIPYQLPGASPENSGIAIHTTADVLKIVGLLGGLLVFVILTVLGEETMFRGLIQTQAGQRYGGGIGLITGALLFGLRHLPNDLFYARLWQATPQMWLSRELQLYLGAIIFGLARYLGKSTYASAITHGLYFFIVLLG